MDMDQRVNIQYSVELRDLEGEVNRLYEKANKEITFLAYEKNPPKLKIGNEALEEIVYIRRKLAKIDIALGDVQNIVEGYIQFMTQPEHPRVPDSPSEAEEFEIEQLEDRIAQFKEKFDAKPDKKSAG